MKVRAAFGEAQLIEAIYGVATGETSWMQVMTLIRDRFDAHIGNMFILARDGAVPEVLDRLGMPAKAIADYAAHFHREDPRLNAALKMMVTDPDATERVWLGSALVPDAILAESGFYRDFGRLFGTRHGLLMAPKVGQAGRLFLSVLRSAEVSNFEEEDRRSLNRLLPHIRRSLQLAYQLHQAGEQLALFRATLDAIKISIIVVDATMQATNVNKAAEGLVSSESGLALLPFGPVGQRGVQLSIRHKPTADIISELVRKVAAGLGSGGSARIPRGATRKPLAVLVMPLPRRLTASGYAAASGTVRGSAMLLFRDLEQPQALEVARVAGMFGLTRAEAEVSIELCTGLTVEAVALRRGTSVTTVRTQVRIVLEKTALRNLRDLAHALAQLG